MAELIRLRDYQRKLIESLEPETKPEARKKEGTAKGGKTAGRGRSKASRPEGGKQSEPESKGSPAKAAEKTKASEHTHQRATFIVANASARWPAFVSKAHR